jgi:UDP-2,4-diacetamido-2,4,6-trideoxy-beta-L-altropyranose hydrolase
LLSRRLPESRMSEKNIAIRVDASNEIGTGHFMRCLTLADGLQQHGAKVCFITRYLPGHLVEAVKKNEHRLIKLADSRGEGPGGDLAHAHWLGTSQDRDAEECIGLLGGQSWDWLVVDHYALDMRWESALRRVAKKILAIDDLADRRHDCDVLLDQNFYSGQDARYEFRVPSDCRLLLGPRYALLRREFGEWHDHALPRGGVVKRILVFFGGVDADNHTGRALRALIALNLENIGIDVVIGALHPDRSSIEAMCKEHGFLLHVQTARMAELMAAADVSIGAGGSTTWERCCLGLATLAICTAKNQSRQLADAAAEGLLFSPRIEGDLEASLKKYVPVFLDNEYLRRVLSLNGMRAVDGRGVLRVAGVLGTDEIEMRMATSADSSRLFEWRNHPSVRKVSRNKEVIPWESHRTWFSEVLAGSSRVLLIGYREGLAVGVVRFDFHGGEAEVSIYLVPDTQSGGLGRVLLLSAERWVAEFRPEAHTVRAHVLGGNEPSHRLFLRADYQVESTCYIKRLK